MTVTPRKRATHKQAAPLQAVSVSPAPAMSAARTHHTATLLSNGKVLLVGGDDGAVITSSSELYDPASNSMSPAAAMSATRSHHSATLLPNRKVLVAGGKHWRGFGFERRAL